MASARRRTSWRKLPGCETRSLSFVRPGDKQRTVRLWGRLGRSFGWSAPEPLDSAIIFAPVGALVPLALSAVRSGGSVVCGGIHMSDIPAFPTRSSGESGRCAPSRTSRVPMPLAFRRSRKPIRLIHRLSPIPLEEANAALSDLRTGALTGAAILVP